MAKDFIEQKIGSSSLAKAREQQKQLSYFTQSSLQEDITQQYIKQWADRKYAGNDKFLAWVKMVFRTENFLSFFKYFRNPVPSARLINDKVIPQLERVFYSDDSYTKYTISGKEVSTPPELDSEDFDKWIFDALLFRHNDILITDLKGVNEPFRELISINNVIAIESSRSKIKRLAYTASVNVTDELGNVAMQTGYIYMDAMIYAFYNEKFEQVFVIPHDLGECPADYISAEAFSDDDVIRKSIFSYIRPDLEEYVFLKTLQKMTEPNGAIPITTTLKTKEKDGKNDIQGQKDGEPMSSLTIGGQKASLGKEITDTESHIQTGLNVKVPIIKKDDGSIDMEAVKHFINFFHMPVEAMKYLKERVIEIENNVVICLTGDNSSEQNESAKNELQVGKSYISKQDVLRQRSTELSRIRKISDFKFLALQHGKDNVRNDAFFGSDFFLESQSELYELFKTSPNTIERKNILVRLTKNKNRFNRDKMAREVLLYELLPYVSDIDFDKAIANKSVDEVTFQYQTRFDYWLCLFESKYGDILLFWEGLGETPANEKIALTNNLIIGIINTERDSAVLTDEEKTTKLLGSISPLVATKILEDMSPDQRLNLIGLKLDPNKVAILPII